MYLLLILVLAHTGTCSLNMGKHLEGRIIHVESIKNRGYWLDAYKKDQKIWVNLRGSAIKNIYSKSWSQFLVTKCEENEDSGTVCLESIKFRGHYLTAEDSWWAKVEQIFYTKNVAKCQWIIRCRNKDMKECWFHSNRQDYRDLYLTAEYKNDWVEVEQKEENALPTMSLFRIFAPNPRSQYIVLKKLTNEGSEDAKYSVKYQYGIEKSTKITNTVAVGLEVETAFKAVSSIKMSMSYEWSKESTDTFRESTEQTLEVTVPPFSIYTIKVLAGIYGPFIVKSKHVIIECVKVKTKKKCSGNDAQVLYK